MKRDNLKSNLIYNSIYQLVVLVMPLITAPYISRMIGAEGLGIYSYNHSIALYFVYFSMLGMANYGNRIIAKCANDRDELSRKFSSLYIFQALICVLVFLVYIIYVVFIIKSNKLIAGIMGFQVISALFDVSWLFFGLQEFKITTIRQLIIKIATFISMIIFVKGKNDLWIYTLIMSMGYFVSSVVLWIMMWKKVDLKKIEFSEVFKHLKPCFILFIPVIATGIYRLMDKVMIGKIISMYDVGYYENAEKIIFVSAGLQSAICTVVMPKISNLLSSGKRLEAKQLFDKTGELCMYIGIAIAFGIASVSHVFIPMFFGNEFEPSVKLSVLLCISFPFMTWSMVIRNLFLIPMEKDKIYVTATLIGTGLNFTINLFLIPRIGTVGAVIGTIISEVFLAIYQTNRISQFISVKQVFRKSILFIVFGIIMYVFVKVSGLFFSNPYISIAVEIFVGMLVYFSLYVIYLFLFDRVCFNEYLNKIKSMKFGGER